MDWRKSGTGLKDMKSLFRWAKEVYYRFFPSGHTSAYIRTLYLKKFLKGLIITRALDAGCGPGNFTIFLAQRHPEAQFNGYDKSESAVQAAVDAAKEAGVTNVDFEVRDLVHLDEQGKYDLVFSLECLQQIPGNQRVIKNLVRALSPGGMLLIIMPCEKTHKFLFPRKWFEEYIKRTEKENIGDQYTRDELIPILEELGLQVLRAQYTFGFWGKLAWEVSMLAEKRRTLHRLLLPLLFLIGYLDFALPVGKGSPYGLAVLGRKVGGVGQGPVGSKDES